jgi:mannose/fructose/N-acetylgalactosamine-specific phosphotransferase system component IID
MKWMIAKGAKSYLEQQQLAYNNDQIPSIKKFHTSKHGLQVHAF